MVKIIFGLGVAMLVLGWWVTQNTRAFKNSPLRAEARVESRKEGERTADRQIKPATLSLLYTHEGREYRPNVNALDTNWSTLKPGDGIRLVLLPSDPTRFVPEASLLQSGKGSWLYTIFFVIGFLLIGLSQVLRTHT